MFDDPRFEKIRTQWIANELYQAIKRVNRQMKHNTNCFLLCNNTEAIEMVADKLINCNVKIIDDININFICSKQKKYIDKLKKKCFANKFIQLLAELQQGQHNELEHSSGTYKKKILRDYIGIKNASNFNQQVLLKSDVISYCKTRNIIIESQYIKFI
jgi:hypothetical protein